MIIFSVSSGYLLDNNYSEYSYYILDKDEDFLVFVICDEPNALRYGFKISEIFSRTFCNEVYNNRYITNLKNLIEVGFHEALKNIKKFIKQKKIEYDNLNLSISGGVYKNGNLMLFSLGNSPIFVIDKNYRLYCPFDLNKNYNLEDWEKFIKFKLIEEPRTIIACSNNLDGKLFKLKEENNKLMAKPFKYKILEIVNDIVSNKENINKIRNNIKNKLNLDKNSPLLIVSFDEKPVDDEIVKLEPVLKRNESEEISEDEDDKKLPKIELNIIRGVSLLLILILVLMFGLFLTLNEESNGNIIKSTNTSLNSSEPIINISTKDMNEIEDDKRLTSQPSVGVSTNVVGKDNNGLTRNTVEVLKFLIKFQVDEISEDINVIPMSITFPEPGYYYIAIKSKDDNVELIDIKNETVLYKNSTLIELFEETKEKEKTYNLIVKCDDIRDSPKDLINITISKIEIIR
ncbi:hypothetical protein [Methanocaldococcus fervens]|uniref:PPM-type phosphatase domain-containing protein n=1 Tax=Methanocaldococcus fervens (strain DSM 4213 / JCM 15782 / AG86) TaxID=573064 RepID=C7P590_METFA|nr:hypothetical protein [Methanocaldococcus fervens]ACV25268.1 hypothetical protein Mefer_1464 [Methanocaldococcus fervens AG86]